MRNLKIMRLTLENFKCHRYLNLMLEGGNVSIYGDNATGKTSVYDALTWLLFGKDSAGNGEKNIDIKPLDAFGQVADHDAVTAVEAVLLSDGEETVLRRTYKEVWPTRRGSSELVYDGNTSEYYVDGVPCKKHAYDDKIRELVPEDVFRLLTSVSYFSADLTWQKRREVLFDMAGTLSDKEILATDSRFAPLLEGMGKLSLDDYKKKLASEKRGFVGAKTEIPARISECQKTIDQLAAVDFAAAKAEADELESKQDSIAAQILAIDHDSAAEQKRQEIAQAQLDLKNLEHENNVFRASQTAGDMKPEHLRRNLAMLQNRLANNQTMLESAQKSIANYEQQIERSRQQWIVVNGEIFTGGICPSCGQALPADKLQAAKERFEAGKKSRLHDIEEIANNQKHAKAQTEVQIRQYQEAIGYLEGQIKEAEADIANADNRVSLVKDLADFAARSREIRGRIHTLSGELYEITQNTDAAKNALRQQLNEIKQQRSEKMAIVSKQAILDYSRERIESLRQDAKNAAECLEAIEKMLYLMDEYSRYKTKFVEDSINSLFRIARFRLFREQANGGIEDRCDVVYEGVPYLGLNNGMKINVGIDIINALSRHYGVCVPLFVDNAESVTRLENAETQVIRLVVSENDKELRIA